MSVWLELCLYALGTLGHVAVCVTALNRVQGTIAEHAVERLFKKAVTLWAIVGLCLPFLEMWQSSKVRTPWQIVAGQLVDVWGYYTLATAWLVMTAVRRLAQVWIDRYPNVWQMLESRLVCVESEVGVAFEDYSTRPFWFSLAGNQIGELEVNKKEIVNSALPVGLDGLKITHFSDLHITGTVPKAYFEWLCQEIQQLNSDIIFLTGDFVDNPEKLAWLVDLVSDLQAEHGNYFVLGNHDVRFGQERRLRECLTDAGWIDLGGKFVQLQIGEHELLLAGNELPWIGQAPDCHPGEQAYSICAVHTPDLLRWGKSQQYDLMLAGHAHGGQIRIPWIGPVVCPSVHGVRYASGVFQAGKTVMHVSRGISGLQPIRLRCRPELTQLILRRSAENEATAN